MDSWNTRLPGNYRDLIQAFYEHGQKKEIVECVRYYNWMNWQVGDTRRVHTRWSKERGLVQITLFDLTARLADEPVPHFEEIGGQDDSFFQLRCLTEEYVRRLRDPTDKPFKQKLKNPLYNKA